MKWVKTYVLSISSGPEVFYKKDVLKIFAKFTEKNLRQSLFSIQLQTSKHITLLKKENLAQVYSCKFCEIFDKFFYRLTPVNAVALANKKYPFF